MAGPLAAALAGAVIVHRPILLAVSFACGAATYVWGRSSRRLNRARMRLEREVQVNGTGQEALELALSAFQKEVHTTVLYGLLTVSALATSLTDRDVADLPFLLVLVPVAISLRYAPRFLAAARLAEERSLIERRAEEVLAQEELAPLRWSARLAPEELPVLEGFEVGTVSAPGPGPRPGASYAPAPPAPPRLP